MRALFPLALASALFCFSTVHADEAPAVAAYHKLTAEELTQHPATTTPEKAERIDVSEEVRSASFGHTTTLLVVGKRFWVEYGRGTNRPKKLFGPFPVKSLSPVR